MSIFSKRSIFTGMMITAGTAIGAGMFSLPVVSSGMWFVPSIICLLVFWYLNLLSSYYLLEINFHFVKGASFNTFVTDILGKEWNVVANISIAFLLYILLYAYFSAFGNIVTHTLGLQAISENTMAKGGVSLLTGGLLALVIWIGTAAVGRFSTVLLVGMIITYVMSMSGLALSVDIDKLFNLGASDTNYEPYALASLPYFVTAFGFATVVPSFYKFFDRDVKKIKSSLLYGSALALLVYAIFIFVSFGNISRDDFVPISAAGGNMGDIVGALQQGGGSSFLNTLLDLFANFAIITSFLGVGLSLFDFVADKFSFEDDGSGRFKSALISFLPVAILSFFFPNGFLLAIGYAGMVAVFAIFIIPFLMVRKIRKQRSAKEYVVAGGGPLLWAFFLLSLLVVVCQVLAKMGVLAVW